MTLRFLGDVDDPGPLGGELAARLASAGPATAVAGPATGELGRGVLVVPVGGLGELAGAVAGPLPGVREPERPFVGHLTIGRTRRRAPVPAEALEVPVAAAWRAERVDLVGSRLSRHGPSYETLRTVVLGAAQGAP